MDAGMCIGALACMRRWFEYIDDVVFILQDSLFRQENRGAAYQAEKLVQIILKSEVENVAHLKCALDFVQLLIKAFMPV